MHLIYRFKVGASLDHGVSLRFVSLLTLRTCWATFQAKNNVKSMRIPQIVTYVAVEKGMEYKGEQRLAYKEP